MDNYNNKRTFSVLGVKFLRPIEPIEPIKPEICIKSGIQEVQFGKKVIRLKYNR